MIPALHATQSLLLQLVPKHLFSALTTRHPKDRCPLSARRTPLILRNVMTINSKDPLEMVAHHGIDRQ